MFCTFHHQVAVRQMGWTVVLNPDGTTTAWNRDKTKVLHSHSPPAGTGYTPGTAKRQGTDNPGRTWVLAPALFSANRYRIVGVPHLLTEIEDASVIRVVTHAA